jgi:hypothetical protein
LKVVILSDYSTGEQLGGGVELASEFAKKLSLDGLATIKLISGEKKNRHGKKSSLSLLNIVNEIFNLKQSLYILARVRSESPNVVWIHQIGHRIPWITLIWLKIFRYPMIITLHDLNIVSPRKIGKEVINFPISQQNSKLIMSENAIKNLFLNFRFYLIRFIVNTAATRIISIGPIQDEILKLLNVKVSLRIPNGIELCDHLDTPERNSRSILFAGRLSRKGLNLTIDSIIRSGKSFHLYLAGDLDLKEYAMGRLHQDDFTYLGRLPRNEITKFLHSVKYVSCLSQYYDNYPTIALEAIAHGAIPITSRLTGVAALISQISPQLILNEGEVPSLIELDKFDFEVSRVTPDQFDLKYPLEAYTKELKLIHDEQDHTFQAKSFFRRIFSNNYPDPEVSPNDH